MHDRPALGRCDTVSIQTSLTRTRCEFYARGYNDNRPLSTPVPEAFPYVDPAKFADWYIANCKDVFAPQVGIADAFTLFKGQITAALQGISPTTL